MATRSEQLAQQYEATASDFESKVQALSDAEWRSTTPVEGWTVAACAHHAAISSGPISMMVAAAAGKGQMPPITAAGLDQMNAEHAKQFAGCSKDETLTALRDSRGPAAGVIRGLSDEDLDKKAMLPLGMELTAEQIIRNVLIGHLQGHAASIGQAVPA